MRNKRSNRFRKILCKCSKSHWKSSVPKSVFTWSCRISLKLPRNKKFTTCLKRIFHKYTFKLFSIVKDFLYTINILYEALLAKNQTNATQHPEAELLQFENYSHSSSRHHPKKRRILKNKQKTSASVFMRLYG